MIGIFDSGVGGLSVFKEIHKLMPNEPFVFVSDGAHCPYGRKTPNEIILRSVAITNFLIDKGADIIVVACNTATAAAIAYLRSHYAIPFVGMEPAVKPAALHSNTGVIGVLATAGTFKGSLYLKTSHQFAANVKIVEQIGDGLVELVESGKTQGLEVETLLKKYINPMIEAHADHIVLGCTHYPFLEEAIKKIVGNDVTIVNPAPAVAAQTQKLLSKLPLKNDKNNAHYFYTTGNVDIMKLIVRQILNISSNCNDFIKTDI